MTQQESTPQDVNRRFDVIDVRTIVLRIRSARRYLVRRIWKILGFAFVFALACSAYFFFKKPTYAAEVSFALDEQAAEIAREDFSDLPPGLGLRASNDAGGSVFSTINNVVELMRSRLLIEKTLRSPVSLGGKPIILADFFLDSLDYRTDWVLDARYTHPDFSGHTKDSAEQLYSDGILQRMYERIIQKMLTITTKGKGTTIVSATCVSTNEQFSKNFIETLMSNTQEFYTESKTQRAKVNLEFIQRRTDSVRNVYNSALYGRAAFTDANLNPGRHVAVVSAEKQQTDIAILRTTYTELSRSLEAARNSLSRETPLFQYLDTPHLPLKKASSPVLLYFIIFFIAGSVLAALYFLYRRWMRIIDPPAEPEFEYPWQQT